MKNNHTNEKIDIDKAIKLEKEGDIIMDKEYIRNKLCEKARSIPLWDNDVKNGLQLYINESKEGNVIINSLSEDMKYIGEFEDKPNLFFIEDFLCTEIFSIDKNGVIKSYLRTGKYGFIRGPFKIDSDHYVWITDSSEAPNMTTLVCTDKDFNFLWEYSYDARIINFEIQVYPVINKGFFAVEEGKILNFFDNEAKLIWEYELPKESSMNWVFMFVEENSIEIFLADMKITIDLSGKLINKEIFEYAFLRIKRVENCTYYQIYDNVKRKMKEDGLSYDLIFNNSKCYLLRENNKTKEITKIDYILPSNYGDIILVGDYCFYQSQLGGGKRELAIIFKDNVLSSFSIPSDMAIDPIINDEKITLFFRPYFGDGDSYKIKNMVIDKNGNMIKEDEYELDPKNYQYIRKVFKMNNELYKIEIKEVFDRKNKDVIFWQFIISLY